MKYRINYLCVRKVSSKKILPASRRVRALTPSALLPQKYEEEKYSEGINFNLLFEISSLPEVQKNQVKKRRRKPIMALLVNIGDFFSVILRFAAKCIRTLFVGRRQKNPRLAFFSGVLCSAVLCAFLSAAVVLVSLFGRFMFYSRSNSINGTDTPAPDSMQIVSLYVVENFVGMTDTLSALELKNKSISFRRTYEYSDTVQRGVVISTSPRAGEHVYGDEAVTLTVSLGRQIKKIKVPDLYGLGEASAAQILSERGLKLGMITYSVSSSPRGAVIAQEYSPLDMIDEGTSVNITVSLGNVIQKKVPDLWGLTQDEAKQKLMSQGLVLGGIFSAQSGAPKGTVISQYPAPGTLITSNITSVDIYISS